MEFNLRSRVIPPGKYSSIQGEIVFLGLVLVRFVEDAAPRHVPRRPNGVTKFGGEVLVVTLVFRSSRKICHCLHAVCLSETRWRVCCERIQFLCRFLVYRVVTAMMELLILEVKSATASSSSEMLRISGSGRMMDFRCVLNLFQLVHCLKVSSSDSPSKTSMIIG